MLQSILFYLIKVTVTSGLLLMYYMMALRNNKFHYYNRFYLLLTVLLSMSLPLLHLEWFTFSGQSNKAIHLYNIINANGEEDVIITGKNSFDWQQFVLLMMISVSTIFLSVAFTSVIKIFRLKKLYPVDKTQDFDFVNTDLQSAPFSFLRNIFWRNDLNVTEKTNQQILQHEITHVQQKHSWDKLFMQFVLCFYWMNPFFWWLQKELNLIHEFIADEKAVQQNDAESFAKMLLTTQYGKFNFYPAQSIFYSPIKRRLIMLTTSKKPQFNYLRRIMVLPLLAVVICLFAFKMNEQHATNKNISITKSATNFKLVVDAGHGGKDYGAMSNNVYEKDIALKIAKEMKALSSQYGIDVVLTRSDDEYQTPQQKSDFANSQNANAFVSLHVNNANEKKTQLYKGIEVVISEKNKSLASQSLSLGSSIIQNLTPNFDIAKELHQSEKGIWVLNNSTIPAALIECGYLSNANDLSVLKQDDKIELMAKNILQGVAMYANNKIDVFESNQFRKSDTTIPQQISRNQASDSVNPPLTNALYIVDGKELNEQNFGHILTSGGSFTITQLSKDDAVAKYGDKGKKGVYIITTKHETKFTHPVIIRDSDGVVNPSNIPGDKIFTQVQQAPSFPGGAEGWRKFLETNLKASTPADKGAPPGTYTVTVSFLVDENGKVSNVKAVTNPGYGTGEEAVRAIAQGPNWIPGVQNGHKVVCETKQNITFQLTQQ